jgi:hypothetical protein
VVQEKMERNVNYPSKTSYSWIRIYKAIPGWLLLIALLCLYILINLLFTYVYYVGKVLGPNANNEFINYFYFTFVTSMTIGYGDFAPVTYFGKSIVIFQACITAIYFAIMIALLSAKMFYPRNTIYFSNKILYDHINDCFGIRMINTHKERLVNPEMRIFMVGHCVGNVVAPSLNVARVDNIPYLGIHDFTLFFSDYLKTGNLEVQISDEWQKAINYDSNNQNEIKSRFRIVVSIAGNYGVKQVVHYKKYYPSDIEPGTKFKAIEYNDEDQRKYGNIRFTRFNNFWIDFNMIIKAI